MSLYRHARLAFRQASTAHGVENVEPVRDPSTHNVFGKPIKPRPYVRPSTPEPPTRLVSHPTRHPDPLDGAYPSPGRHLTDHSYRVTGRQHTDPP